MTTALQDSRKLLMNPPLGTLPARMRLLFITTSQRTGGWLAESFACDSASEVVLEEAVGLTAGLTRVRDEAFDAVLLSHDPGDFDALEFVQGLRAGGSNEPMIVLGTQSEQEMAALCYEVNADAYVCVNTTTTRTLIWVVARAIERHRLIRENRRLWQAERHRLHLEHNEAQRLLDQQRQLVSDLEALREDKREREGEGERGRTNPADDSHSPPLPVSPSLSLPTAGPCVESTEPSPDDAALPPAGPPPLPAQLVAHYRELLRAYVIMGSGNLSREMSMLAELLVSASISARQTMQLHLHALEDLLQGLGSRSTRHVMSRADLLVLEVMVNLAEGYRRLYHERLDPPRQQLLPGFDAAA